MPILIIQPQSDLVSVAPTLHGLSHAKIITTYTNTNSVNPSTDMLKQINISTFTQEHRLSLNSSSDMSFH